MRTELAIVTLEVCKLCANTDKPAVYQLLFLVRIPVSFHRLEDADTFIDG